MLKNKTVSQCISSDYCKGWNDAVNAMPKWIHAAKELPTESGTYLVGCVNKWVKDGFYNISILHYCAEHKKFNVYSFQSETEVERYAFDNRKCYWMPVPKPPKETDDDTEKV